MKVFRVYPFVAWALCVFGLEMWARGYRPSDWAVGFCLISATAVLVTGLIHCATSGNG